MTTIERIISSDETKALETAGIIAEATRLEVEVRPDMGENDRSATGFLPPGEFETVADQFFAHPHRSARGWATAAAEQARIVGAIDIVLRNDRDSRGVLFVGHGAVGALYLCHLLAVPIARALDQPAGGGNVYAWQPSSGRVLHRWRTIEEELGT